MTALVGMHQWSAQLRLPDKCFLAICIPCGNRREHLEKTLAETLAVVRQTQLGVVVIAEVACKQRSGQWAAEVFADDVAAGHLVVLRNSTEKKFRSGFAKALAHSVGCEYADYVLNLDADNFFTTQDMVAISRVAMRQSQFIGQQLGEHWDSFGRIVLPTELYRKIGGYPPNLKHYGYEDRGLLQKAMAQPGVALVSVPHHAKPALSHDDEARMENFPGGTKVGGVHAHIRASEKEFLANPADRLKDQRCELVDKTGLHQVIVRHAEVELAVPVNSSPKIAKKR
jgi:hypothetical protein